MSVDKLNNCLPTPDDSPDKDGETKTETEDQEPQSKPVKAEPHSDDTKTNDAKSPVNQFPEKKSKARRAIKQPKM